MVSLPKIVAKISRNITGSRTVKNTEAGLRQNVFWSNRNWWATRAAELIRRDSPQRRR